MMPIVRDWARSRNFPRLMPRPPFFLFFLASLVSSFLSFFLSLLFSLAVTVSSNSPSFRKTLTSAMQIKVPYSPLIRRHHGRHAVIHRCARQCYHYFQQQCCSFAFGLLQSEHNVNRAAGTSTTLLVLGYLTQAKGAPLFVIHLTPLPQLISAIFFITRIR